MKTRLKMKFSGCPREHRYGNLLTRLNNAFSFKNPQISGGINLKIPRFPLSIPGDSTYRTAAVFSRSKNLESSVLTIDFTLRSTN